MEEKLYKKNVEEYVEHVQKISNRNRLTFKANYQYMTYTNRLTYIVKP